MKPHTPTGQSGIETLEEVADILVNSQDDRVNLVGDAIKQYLNGDGTLDEAFQIAFDIRDHNERFEVARRRRNGTLVAAADLLPPGSRSQHARLLRDYARGTLPASQPPEVLAAINHLRTRPLSLNQLEEILRRG